MAETLIIILADHNVPINFADHFTKLVSNKLVFPDSVFLRVRAARAPCSLKVVITRVLTNFFFQKLNRSVNKASFFQPLTAIDFDNTKSEVIKDDDVIIHLRGRASFFSHIGQEYPFLWLSDFSVLACLSHPRIKLLS